MTSQNSTADLVPVSFEDNNINAPAGYQDLTLAILKAGIGLMDVTLDPPNSESEQELNFIFFDHESCSQFVDAISTFGDPTFVSTIFNPENAGLHGNFFVDQMSEDEDGGLMTTVILSIPISAKDALLATFTKLYTMMDAEVEFCDN